MMKKTDLQSQSNEVIIGIQPSRQKRFIERCRYYYRIPNRCYFIQGLLMSDSLSELVVVSMLMTYLTDIRKENLISAAATVNILEGLSGILSVPASFLKDYLGSYNMVLLTYQFYNMGVLLLSISALLRTWRYRIENPLLYMSLILIVLGKAGSSSSCVEDFLWGQLKNDHKYNKDHDEKKNEARQMFWMQASQFLGLILGAGLLALTDNLIIQYGSCAITMRLALGVFLIGSPFYITLGTDGFHQLFKCCKKTTITYTSPSNVVDCEGERNQNLHTIDEEEEMKENKKILLLLVPMSVTFLICGIVKSIGTTFFLEQGNNMNNNQTNEIPILPHPITILLIVGNISRRLFKFFIERLLRNRLTGPRKIYATLIRIGVGLIFSVICCATAQAVEAKRLGIVVQEGFQNCIGDDDDYEYCAVFPMSVFFLLPQFIFLGAMRGLTGDGMEVLYESELPKCMKRSASALTKAVTGMGTLLSVGLVSITAKASTIGGGSSWFENTINRSHLDHFYRGLTMLCLMMCFVFVYVSTSYVHKRLPRNEEEDCEDLAQPRLELEITVI